MPKKYKNKLEKIDIVIMFNARYRTTWGAAQLINSRNKITKKLKLENTVPYKKIEGRKSWFLLELNPRINKASEEEVYDTVSHELAHLLDFCFFGFYNRTKGYHHEEWVKIHKAMGGCGKAEAIFPIPKRNKT